MAVYIDRAFIPFKRMVMCHMIADTLDELHAMAELIGMKRAWFQPKSFPHYDVCKMRRSIAIENGAIEVDRRELVRKMREIRNLTIQFSSSIDD
jgi:hypothetical protein